MFDFGLMVIELTQQRRSHYNACNCLSGVVSVKKEQKCCWMFTRMNRHISNCSITKIDTVLFLCSLRREFCTGYNVTSFAVTDFFC
jgi:hypothetical protein